jgi:hypothetical protein
MNSNQKKIMVLTGLGLTWGGLLAWQLLTWEEPVRVPLTNVTGSVAVSPQAHGMTGELRVQLDLLSAARTQREMVFTTPRNIFALPSPTGSNQGTVEPVSDLALRQQAVAAELSQFHYLGYVRVGEEWQKKQDLAVLTRNDDLHVVKRGETLDKHVLVKAITQESVTLQDRDTRVEYTVLLSEEPLSQSPIPQ